MASMKIEVSEDRELILSDVFSGIGIKTDQGRFGIAQRDGGIEIVKDGKIVWSSTSGPFFVADPKIKATSLRPPPEQVVVEETPESGPKEKRWNAHEWIKTCVCKNCGTYWTALIEHDACSGDDPGERALVQLAGCLVAAEGYANATGTNNVETGDYGWSPAFQAVKDLWDEGDRLRMSLEHCRQATMPNFDADALPATGEEGVELYAFTAIRELRDRYDAECAANADKVQIIERQCQERRVIKATVEKGDMPGLRAILFPPESDEPESVKKTETEIKTVVLDAGPDHLKIVEIENVTALRAERDDLKESLATCERAAVDDSSTLQGTADAAIFSVMDLCADRDRLRKAAKGLHAKVLAGVRCTCAEDQGNPPCPKFIISPILRDFEQRAGVAEEKGPERAHDVTPPAATPPADPCAPGKLKDKLVLRFSGPPGSSGRFIEAEMNGKSIVAGRWAPDGEDWLLVINPDVIPQPPQRLVASLPDWPTDDEVIERMRSILPAFEGVEELRAERDQLRRRHKKARAELLKRAPCTCSGRAGKHGNPHEPDCRLGIAIMEF